MIFIPGNVPSLKNSKIKTSRGIFPSKTVKSYLSSLGIQSYSASKKEVKGYKTRENIFLELFKDIKIEKYPVIVHFHFVRDSKRKWDFNNANSILTDLMTAHNIIEDDNMDCIIPQCLWIDNKQYSYDKEKPGVYVKFEQI
jgi:hypothetical protein